jgi:hypothetical protein
VPITVGEIRTALLQAVLFPFRAGSIYVTRTPRTALQDLISMQAAALALRNHLRVHLIRHI